VGRLRARASSPAERFDGGFCLDQRRTTRQGIGGIEPDEVEAGWVIAEEERGRGLATEAMRAAIPTRGRAQASTTSSRTSGRRT